MKSKQKKFNRRVDKKFVKLAKVELDPKRALKHLKKLKNRAIVMDSRTVRQSVGIQPAVISTMEARAIRDAIRMFKVRLKLLHDGLEQSA